MDNWTTGIHMLRDGFLLRVSSKLDEDSDVIKDQPLPLIIRVDALGPSRTSDLIYDRTLAETYLGGCYYDSVHEFIALSGLYEDMLDEVLREARKAEHEQFGHVELMPVMALSQTLAEEKARTEWPYWREGWAVKRSTQHA